MTVQQKLAQFWENEVPGKYKHYQGTEFGAKSEDYIGTIQQKLMNHIDFANIHSAIDWGCGGGQLALMLSSQCSISIVDITQTSLEQCEELFAKHGKTLEAKYKLEDIDKLSIERKSCDLLFSASVIQHFPSYEYWEKVSEFWKNLNPQVIAIQTRHGEKNEFHEETYFDSEKDYILGLRLTTQEVMKRFDKTYDLRHHSLDDDGWSMYEYFIFTRKQA